MPNHVVSIIRCENPAVLQALLSEEGVDFGRVIPPPPNIEEGGCTGRHPEGVVCWYRWNVDNWGTKWNAYSQDLHVDEGWVKFETAWSHPFPVVFELSKRFPDDVIDVEFADEDLGYNVGVYKVKGGAEFADSSPDEGSPEALDLAAGLHYGQTYAQLQEEWGEA